MPPLGSYTLLRELGRGGMGEVFLAVRSRVPPKESLGAHTFAIKRLLPELARNAEAVDLWRDELTLATLLRHANVARLVEIGEDRGVPYLVLEYVSGMSVRALVDRHRALKSRLPARAAVLIAAQVADALAYAHALSDPKTRAPLHLVHRDVSPRNILVSTAGDVKLIDFGVAKSQIQEHRSVLGRPKGKRRYMSPEQSLERPIDGRSDQFSLALVLAEMLTGTHPFDDADPDTLAKAIRSGAAQLPGGVDPGLDAIDPVLAHALAKKPDHRFPDAAAFAEALRAASSSLPASAVKLDRLVGGLLDEETSDRIRALARAEERWSAGAPLAPAALVDGELQRAEQEASLRGPRRRGPR